MGDIIARMREALDALDRLAEGRGDEALDELNAEFEDALFMMEQADGDDPDDLADALEELEALWQDYMEIDGAQDIAAKMKEIIEGHGDA
ncbi:MAG: hypothetical protein IJ646_10160 [Clostridia bacterium]|nr:hypothetical protein [Clostridia bacterium]